MNFMLSATKSAQQTDWQCRRTASRLTLAIATVTAAMIASFASPAYAGESTRNFQAAVHRMSQWIGTGEKAAGWRRFLLLNLLDAQVAKGEQADLDKLTWLLERFSQDVDGLDHPAFVDVRFAIEQQIQQLAKIHYPEYSDLQYAVARSIDGYRPFTIGSLRRDRDLAVYELQLLKSQYRRTLVSRDRAEIFHELNLDESIEFLESIEFELPPEVSVGKMTSMIVDQQKILSEVNDAIDALPVGSPGPDDDDDSSNSESGSLAPPMPDNGERSLAELKEKKATLTERIDELKKQRKEIFVEDKPRLQRRRDIGRELQSMQKAIEAVGQRQLDPYYVSASMAFETFYYHYLYGTQDNVQEDFLKRVAELQELLPSLDVPTDRGAQAKVGEILEWLERRRQLPTLTTAIRARYSNPNLYLAISSNLINAEPVSQSDDSYLKDLVFGKIVRGRVSTNATVYLEPQDDPDQVHISVHLLGSVASSSYIRQGSLRVDAATTGSLEARRSLYLNTTGFYAGAPSASAWLDNQFAGINSNCGLIQKIALKKFCEAKARSDYGASEKAREQLLDQFTGETSQTIADGQEQFADAIERGQAASRFLPEIFLRSFTDRVEVVGKKQNVSALAAPGQPQPQFAGRDVQLSLHESLASNYLDPIFAGKTFSRQDLADEAEKMTGEVPEFLKPMKDKKTGEPMPDFVITFARVRPIQLKYEDSQVKVSITGERFAQGDRSITTELKIELALHIVNVNGKLLLETVGKPTIKLSEDKKPNGESIAFAAILEKQIEADDSDPRDQATVLPPNLIPELDQLKDVKILDDLQLGLLKMENGWLYLGWNRFSGPVDTPGIMHENIVSEIDSMYIPSESAPADEQRSVLIPTDAGETVLPEADVDSPQLIPGSSEPTIAAPLSVRMN